MRLVCDSKLCYIPNQYGTDLALLCKDQLQLEFQMSFRPKTNECFAQLFFFSFLMCLQTSISRTRKTIAASAKLGRQLSII